MPLRNHAAPVASLCGTIFHSGNHPHLTDRHVPKKIPFGMEQTHVDVVVAGDNPETRQVDLTMVNWFYDDL